MQNLNNASQRVKNPKKENRNREKCFDFVVWSSEGYDNDGWHSYDAAYNDIIRWGSIVNKGGIIAVDDYSWDDVKRAIADARKELNISEPEKVVADNLALIHV